MKDGCQIKSLSVAAMGVVGKLGGRWREYINSDVSSQRAYCKDIQPCLNRKA